MNRAEIISEIRKLPHADHREILRCFIEADEAALTLADCDRRVLKRFQMFGVMEAGDETGEREFTDEFTAKIERRTSGHTQLDPCFKSARRGAKPRKF